MKPQKHRPAVRVVTHSAKETERVGKKLATILKGGEVILLRGTLGAGKTTLLKGLAKGLGVRQAVTSPTFVLMKVYPTKPGKIKTFVHVDCYRVPGAELASIGLADYIQNPGTVVAVEWSEKMKRKPRGATTLTLTHGKKLTERTITIKSPRQR